jgi:uncharacterized membrane protein
MPLIPAAAISIDNFYVHAVTMFIAALPVSELRGAIPYAIKIGGIPWYEAYIMAVIGNFIPVIPILLLLGRVSEWLMRYRLWNKFFTWLFNRTRVKGRLIEKFEIFGLIVFVSIPLPVTGAWTGCVAAYLFGIPLKKAVPAIIAGILTAGTVVTLATLGIISFFSIGSS